MKETRASGFQLWKFAEKLCFGNFYDYDASLLIN